MKRSLNSIGGGLLIQESTSHIAQESMAMATEVAWRQDALEFEEAKAKELRQDLQSEAEANKARDRSLVGTGPN